MEQPKYEKPADLDTERIRDFCNAVEKSEVLRRNFSVERCRGDVRHIMESIALGFNGVIDKEDPLSDVDGWKLQDICSTLGLTDSGYIELVTLFIKNCVKEPNDELYRILESSALKSFLVDEYDTPEDLEDVSSAIIARRRKSNRPKQLSADFRYLEDDEFSIGSRNNSIASQPVQAPFVYSKSTTALTIEGQGMDEHNNDIEAFVSHKRRSSRGSIEVFSDDDVDFSMPISPITTPRAMAEPQTTLVLDLYTRSFEKVDTENTGKITIEQFKEALELVKEQKPNFQTSQVPAEYIFQFFLQPGGNTIAYTEFLKLMEKEAAEFQYVEDQELKVEVYKTPQALEILESESFPTTSMLAPSVVQEYAQQALEMKKKEQELNVAQGRTRQMEFNINRLEVEKWTLQNDAQVLRNQLNQLYDENAQERASVLMANIEKEQFEAAIRSREMELLRIEKLWNATKSELNSERRAHDMHIDLYRWETQQQTEKEKEIHKLRAQLKKVETVDRKDAETELENLKVLLATQESEKKKMEAANRHLREQLEQAVNYNTSQHQEKVEKDKYVVRFESDIYDGATEPLPDPLTLEVELGSKSNTLRRISDSNDKTSNFLQVISTQKEEAEDSSKHIIDLILTNVCNRIIPEIYEVTVTTRNTLGFVIWKDDHNNNAMVMKTSHESANNGIKVGSWINTVNGRYVDGLPFECILHILRKASRPLRIGFRDDPQTRSLDYVDKLENENRVKNYEIQRIHMKYEDEVAGQVSDGWKTRAQQRRLEKNANCIIQ